MSRLWMPDNPVAGRILTVPAADQLRAGQTPLTTLLGDILTTRGDILRRGASAAERLALGQVGRSLASNGTDVTWLGGRVVSIHINSITSAATTSTVIPADDTVPTSSEGAQFSSITMTPIHADNKIVIFCQAMVSGSHAGTIPTVTLFQSSTCLAVQWCQAHTNGGVESSFLFWQGTALSTTSRTYSARFGPQSNTAYLNGSGGARRYGATHKSGLLLLEIAG